MADAAARKALERERKRAQGLIKVEVWIPDTPAAKQAVRKLVAKLKGER